MALDPAAQRMEDRIVVASITFEPVCNVDTGGQHRREYLSIDKEHGSGAPFKSHVPLPAW